VTEPTPAPPDAEKKRQLGRPQLDAQLALSLWIVYVATDSDALA
jgi:hypothetical protein